MNIELEKLDNSVAENRVKLIELYIEETGLVYRGKTDEKYLVWLEAKVSVLNEDAKKMDKLKNLAANIKKGNTYEEIISNVNKLIKEVKEF